jgi:hypothetical protein
MPGCTGTVPAWWVERGVGHAVLWTEGGGGFTATLCGSVVAGATVTTGLPGRVCRECRRRLPQARILERPRTEAIE